jgi:ABC-type transport system involved in multi-copper enzyme maturation permease subunit
MRLAVVRWLVADTFRQSLWTGVFWLMLGVTVLCTLFCLAAGFTKLGTDEAHVRDLQFGIAGWGANIVGLLLALTFTSGFLPSFADPNTALILLAKPVSRRLMFLGKFLGVLALFALHATLFIVATWFALGISTGSWSAAYLATLPILLLNFAAFFSFSGLLAVTTRNAVACVIGSVLFWLLCVAMNLGRHGLVAYDLESFSAASRFLSEVSYWILPKPVDLLAVLHDMLNSPPLAERMEDFARIQDKGAFHPALSLAASLLFPIVVVAMSAYEIETIDY